MLHSHLDLYQHIVAHNVAHNVNIAKTLLHIAQLATQDSIFRIMQSAALLAFQIVLNAKMD